MFNNEIALGFQLEVDFLTVFQSHGRIDVKDIENKIKPNTCMVTVMQANNETGVIMPLEEIAK